MDALLERHGVTYCEELGIPIEKGTPSPLFMWLVASLLFSARISTELAASAAKALFEAGWRTADAMGESTWEERVRVLNHAGYARYDESTARMLGDTVALLRERYRGDLRALREAAGRDPAAERRLLKECKGIGDVGASIFLREVQAVWEENHPFADARILETAASLGLPDTAEALAALVPRERFTRLLAALVRTRLAGDAEAIRAAATS